MKKQKRNSRVSNVVGNVVVLSIMMFCDLNFPITLWVLNVGII